MSEFISSLNLHSTAIKSMPEILFEESISTQKTIVWEKNASGMDKAFYVSLSEFYGVMFCKPRVKRSELFNHNALTNIIPDFLLPKLQNITPINNGNFTEKKPEKNLTKNNNKALDYYYRKVNENNKSKMREYEPAYKTEVIKFIAKIKPIMQSSTLDPKILPIIKEVTDKQALYDKIKDIQKYLDHICMYVGELTFVIEEKTHNIKLIDLAAGSGGESAKKNQPAISSGLMNIQEHIQSKYLNNKNNVDSEYSRLPKNNTIIYGYNYK